MEQRLEGSGKGKFNLPPPNGVVVLALLYFSIAKISCNKCVNAFPPISLYVPLLCFRYMLADSLKRSPKFVSSQCHQHISSRVILGSRHKYRLTPPDFSNLKFMFEYN